MRGAGGTEGGAGRFLLGFVMLCGGGYLFLDNIAVRAGLGWGGALYQMGGVGITSGMVLLPFVLGVGVIFYSARNPLGWLLAAGSLVALAFGVISRVRFEFAHMSAFDLLVILTLSVGGLGLLLSSLRARDAGDRDERAAP